MVKVKINLIKKTRYKINISWEGFKVIFYIFKLKNTGDMPYHFQDNN
jgi:hypothetical protein